MLVCTHAKFFVCVHTALLQFEVQEASKGNDPVCMEQEHALESKELICKRKRAVCQRMRERSGL